MHERVGITNETEYKIVSFNSNSGYIIVESNYIIHTLNGR